MKHEQLNETHHSRLAYVYIRQSSVHQVEHHTESQRRQRGLVERAVALGWPNEQVQVFVWFLVPYLAWVSFAALLNGSIWWLN